MFELSCVAVSKKEAPYLKDWIVWHHRLGVEHFFIYDACADLATFKVLEPFVWAGLVTLIPTTFHPCQYQAYQHCYSHQAGKSDWVLTIDIDEFVNPFGLETTDLRKWLQGYNAPGIGGVALAWHCFGTSESDKYENVPVWQRITKRVDYEETQKHHTKHIKSFVRPQCVLHVNDPHWIKTKPGFFTVDPNNRPLNTSEYKSWDFPVDRIVLNHYVTKTREEWEAKFQRGSADSGPEAYNARKLEAFDAHVKACTREDKTIWSVARKIGMPI
jgi:hypothetical protein